MKRAAPWEEAYTISSSDSSDSDSDDDNLLANKKGSTKIGGSQSFKGIMSEGALFCYLDLFLSAAELFFKKNSYWLKY